VNTSTPWEVPVRETRLAQTAQWPFGYRPARVIAGLLFDGPNVLQNVTQAVHDRDAVERRVAFSCRHK
jgi:hypothetical protein